MAFSTFLIVSLAVYGLGIKDLTVVSTAASSERTAVSEDKKAQLVCPGAGLLISEVFTNPSGDDSPFEYVELIATTSIDFSVTPHSVVFTNNGTATAQGWRQGGGISYGFNITSGSVTAGNVVYVGGSSMTPTGPKLRTINTATTAGDTFGNAVLGGVLGNGGGNADSVAVFSVATTALNDTTIPIDAIFFGTAMGSAVVAGGTDGYVMPVNDRYTGGFLQSTSFLAADPGNLALIATGEFSTATCDFTAARTWAAGAGTDSISAVVLSAGAGTPTISENTATPYLNLPATIGGATSGVIGDPTDPARTLGVDFTIADSDTPVGNLTVTATSSNVAVVPNAPANLNLTGAGATRNLKITPTGVGYSNISVTVSDGTSNSSYLITFASSTGSATPTSTKWHTGKADASTAIAIDADHMFVADDEDQTIRLYNRNNSGLPLASFDFTASLGLTDINNGAPREVDIEASTRVGNRIYWLASHSNSSGGELRPNRYRLFATDVSGAAAAATLSYVGRYDGLLTNLVNWDSGNGHGLGANFFGFAASSANGQIPEQPGGGGFNIEGLTMAPDGVTAYVAFRAPISPASARTRALIVPVTNLAALVTANPSPGPAVFGVPIQLDLQGRGIRSIERGGINQYLIVGGNAGSGGNFRLYFWTGSPSAPAQPIDTPLTGLNPEAIVEVPDPLVGASVQLLSDNGDDIYYGDGIIAKDLPQNNHKKFRSDVVSIAQPTAAGVTISGRILSADGRAVRNAIVVLTDDDGQTRTAVAGRGGMYLFDDVEAGRTYVFSVNSRRFTFTPRVLTVTDEVTGFDLVAEP